MVLAVFVGFWDTVLSDQDGFGRMFADGTRRLLGSRWTSGRWADEAFLQPGFILVLVTALPIVLYLTTEEPVALLKLAGAIEAAHIPVVAALTLYLNRRDLPPDLRPSWLTMGRRSSPRSTWSGSCCRAERPVPFSEARAVTHQRGMGNMPPQWSNWSGSLRFMPAQTALPTDEDELTALVRRAAEAGRTVRPVGSRHSSTELIATDDILVAFDHLQGIVAADRGRAQATVKPGTTLEELGRDLARAGLDFPNLGDVATQTVAGVIATGTHGSGRDLPNLACLLVGGRLVTGTGEIVEFGANDIEVLRAARVSLGVLGIMTQLRLQLVPSYTIQRREHCSTMDAFWPHLDELIAENRSFDFYWYPRSDEVKLRLLNPPGGGTANLPYARLVTDERGPAHQLIPRHSHLPYPFDEMEYAIPAEAASSCFQDVRERVKAKHRRTVGWRVLFRTVAADDAYLSPASGRPTVAISLHQNATLPFWEYFLDIEPVFRAYAGRPHWAKKHTLRAAELRPLYPGWDRFLAVRQRLDPRGVFLSPYLRELLGVEQ